MTPYYADDLVTIYHGDCREWMPEADAVITDPPYGVGVPYGPSYDDARLDYWPWMQECVAAMRLVAPVVALTHRVAALAQLSGWDWVAVWDKGGSLGPRVGNSPLVAGWEPIFLYGVHSLGLMGPGLPDVVRVHPEPTNNRTDGRVGREKWSIAGIAHPVPKPLGLYRRLVDTLTRPGQLVLDPFAGTGTTLVAAKEAGRRAIGIEIEEAYCERMAVRLGQEVLGLLA